MQLEARNLSKVAAIPKIIISFDFSREKNISYKLRTADIYAKFYLHKNLQNLIKR